MKSDFNKQLNTLTIITLSSFHYNSKCWILNYFWIPSCCACSWSDVSDDCHRWRWPGKSDIVRRTWRTGGHWQNAFSGENWKKTNAVIQTITNTISFTTFEDIAYFWWLVEINEMLFEGKTGNTNECCLHSMTNTEYDELVNVWRLCYRMCVFWKGHNLT